MMRSPLGRRVPADTAGIVRSTVGNAIVLSTADAMSEQARDLAFAVRPDDQNDVLVLDLPGEQPIGIWESVAGVVGRRWGSRGLRLLVCGQRRETAALAGQWLSDRLGRAVLAPHGDVVLGKAGQLFVHATDGSGWVRHRPGKPPRWEAKRFPRPAWDAAAVDAVTTSAAGIAEPLPGGVWIHTVREDGEVGDHRRRLVGSMPYLPELMPVVLGCPGLAPLSLDDIARFWRGLSDEARQRVRFAQYGPVQHPRGTALGQMLADLLGEPVVFFTGIPLGDDGDLELYTVTGSGGLGWRTFALELGYQPRSGAQASPPRLLSWRAPQVLGEAIEPRVYWYATDAVVEIVQSGLWIRAVDPPRGADRVRAAVASADSPAFIYDDSSSAWAGRMRALAEDVVARLDPATRNVGRLLPASTAVARAALVDEAAGVVSGSEEVRAGGLIQDEPTAVILLADIARGSLAPEVAAPMPFAPSPFAPSPFALSPFAPSPEEPTGVVLAAELGQPTVLLEEAEERETADVRGTAGSQEIAGSPGAADSSETVDPAGEFAAGEFAAGHVAEPSSDDAGLVAAMPAAAPPAAEMSFVITSPVPSGIGSQVRVGASPPRPAEEESQAAGTPPPAVEPASTGVRRQPTPGPAAAAVLRGRSLADERAWLRRTLSREFDAVSSSVSRVLSELPGLQGTDAAEREEILVDAVAVRLLLSPRGATIDAGLRSAAKGAHVPLARCAAAGLSRLPSHRGPTIIPASPVAAEWALLRSARLLTDWGFLSALAEPSDDLTGDTDVLVWSMTGRRTRSLEPSGGADRVVFLPGTSFLVLELAEPQAGTRGRMLLRELSADEIDEDGRVSGDRAFLDEVAGNSLRRKAEDWAGREPSGRVGEVAAGRIGALPGLAPGEGARS